MVNTILFNDYKMVKTILFDPDHMCITEYRECPLCQEQTCYKSQNENKTYLIRKTCDLEYHDPDAEWCMSGTWRAINDTPPWHLKQ